MPRSVVFARVGPRSSSFPSIPRVYEPVRRRAVRRCREIITSIRNRTCNSGSARRWTRVSLADRCRFATPFYKSRRPSQRRGKPPRYRPIAIPAANFFFAKPCVDLARRSRANETNCGRAVRVSSACAPFKADLSLNVPYQRDRTASKLIRARLVETKRTGVGSSKRAFIARERFRSKIGKRTLRQRWRIVHDERLSMIANDRSLSETIHFFPDHLRFRFLHPMYLFRNFSIYLYANWRTLNSLRDSKYKIYLPIDTVGRNNVTFL